MKPSLLYLEYSAQINGYLYFFNMYLKKISTYTSNHESQILNTLLTDYFKMEPMTLHSNTLLLSEKRRKQVQKSNLGQVGNKY